MTFPTTGNADVDRGIISLVLTAVTAWLGRTLQPKARIVFYVPYESDFHIPNPTNPGFLIRTRSVRVENIGRDTASNIEVHFAFEPEHFKLTPTLNNQVIKTPQNNCIVKIPTLAPKEGFWIEMITSNALPNLTNVRSDGGPAKSIRVRVQRILPNWALAIVWVLFILGLTTFFYMLLLAGRSFTNLP